MGSASSARQTSSTTAARLRPRAGPASSRTDRSAQGRESPAVRAASLPSPFSPYGADHQHAPSIVSSPSHRRARHVPSTGLSPLRDAVFIPRRPRQRDGPYRRPAEAASRERYHRSTTSSTSTRRPAQFEPAWGLLAAVAGVAVDVDGHGAQRATGMGRRSCCRPWRIRPARRGELRAHRQGARRRPCGLCPRPTRARVVGCWDKTHGPVGHTSDLHRSAQPGYTGAVARDRHYIAVVGAGACEPEVARVAEEVGRLVARAGAVLVCGGLGGVMEAACRGARAEGGTTVGAAGAWHGRGLVCYARSSAGRKRRVGRTPIIGPTVMAPRKAYETGQP